MAPKTTLRVIAGDYCKTELQMRISLEHGQMTAGIPHPHFTVLKYQLLRVQRNKNDTLLHENRLSLQNSQIFRPFPIDKPNDLSCRLNKAFFVIKLIACLACRKVKQAFLSRQIFLQMSQKTATFNLQARRQNVFLQQVAN